MKIFTPPTPAGDSIVNKVHSSHPVHEEKRHGHGNEHRARNEQGRDPRSKDLASFEATSTIRSDVVARSGENRGEKREEYLSRHSRIIDEAGNDSER